MTRRLGAVLLAALMVIVVGCGRYPASSRRDVRIGDRTWTMLLADRDGMRRMESFEGADGMLFDFDQDVDPAAVAFVMDGVLFPLDIAWFSEAGDLVGVQTMAVCPAKPCPTYAPDARYRWAVEAPAGALSGLAPTDRLDASP